MRTHDTLPLGYVMMVTNPTATPGGRFEHSWAPRLMPTSNAPPTHGANRRTTHEHF
ncbi:MAG: hypothetical protein ACI8TP_000540 [Acidimicrobiales bacterium]|jgi:hypothetical protein